MNALRSLDCPNCRLPTRSTRVPHGFLDRCPRFRSGCCPACQKLSDLELKIEEARRVLAGLLDERELIAPTLNEHHDPFSNRLPVEIASNIFVRCRPPVPRPFDDTLWEEKDLLRVLCTLGQVCKNWRSIARKTPQLWSFFCGTIKPSNCVPWVGVVSQWINNSGALPLSVHLRVSLQEDPQIKMNDVFFDVVRKAFAPAIRHASRWRSVNLDFPSHLWQWISNSLSTQNMDSLECIVIPIVDSDLPKDTEVLRLAASPRRVALRGCDFKHVTLGLHNLTHLFLRRLTLQESVAIFKEATQLSTCLIREVVDSIPKPQDSVRSGLKRLEVASFPSGFWDCFSLPSLDMLDIRKAPSGTQNWHSLKALIIRSTPRITNLTIQDDEVVISDIVDILKLTPALQLLTIEGDDLQESFISELDAQVTSDETFLSKLKTFHFESYQPAFAWASFIPFLITMSSRRSPSLQIFQFVHHEADVDEVSCDFVEKRTLQLILEICQELDVKIKDQNYEDLLARLCKYHGL